MGCVVMIKAAILIDENNLVSQLKMMGIQGLHPWGSIREVMKELLQREYGPTEVVYHYYGAAAPLNKNIKEHYNRKRFFQALRKDNIIVHEGRCISNNSRWEEKGIDVMIALDVVELSKTQNIIFLFSGDSDLAPAVERVKGPCKIVSVISSQLTSRWLKKVSDSVLPLEALIEIMDKSNIRYIEKQEVRI